MKPCWSRSSPFPSQSGRQELNLPQTAYQAVASPLSPRPEQAPCTGIEPVLPGRQPGRCTPASSQGVRVSGGSRTRLSDAAGRCLGCSATDTTSKGGRSRTLCVRVGAALLSREHTPVNQRKGQDSNLQGLAPCPASDRVPSCLLARPSVAHRSRGRGESRTHVERFNRPLPRR